jgi:predicted MPP superfamily phosphohydrolase
MVMAGIALADNRAFGINKDGERIKIGGVGDYLEDIQDLDPTIGDVRKDDYVMLLSHNPDYAELIKTEKIDLMFSGHTHGGQVDLFGFWAPIVPSRFGQKYRTGLVDLQKFKIIISNGIGTISPPVRFFARPQIVTVILKTKPD